MNAIEQLKATAGTPAVIFEPTQIFFKVSGNLEIKDTGKALPYVEGALISIDQSETASAGRDGKRAYVRLTMYNKEPDGSEQFYVVHLPLSGETHTSLGQLWPSFKGLEASRSHRFGLSSSAEMPPNQSGRAEPLSMSTQWTQDSPRKVLPDIRARYIERNQIALAINWIASRIGNQAMLPGECPTQARSLTPSQATS